ncbi:MAG: tripartite tricarboxylate transporter substrate binding protein [Betaproteobacteria bacterium]|nr:MAG: tripartite tricarboxylate transporter substrate binding protein [Betaproteobacteria bacterium]
MAHQQITLRQLMTVAAGIVLAGAVPAAAAQSWAPEKAVEVVVSSAPGGSNDRIARTLQRIIQEQKLVPVPVSVLNKPGGNQTISRVYINQNPGDAHFMDIGNPTLIANTIAGRQQYTDFTPIALLVNEFTAFSVRADSPYTNAKELVAQLKKDPDSIAIGVSNRGGTNHLAMSLLAKAGGVDPRRLKIVVFKTNAEGLTAVLGGHIHVVASAVGTAVGQMRDGKTRIISVSAPQRMGGDLAEVPTLREQGYDVSLSNWRALVGPKGLSAAQVGYWEDVLTRVVATDAWKAILARYFWDGNFLRSREFGRYMESEYAQIKTIMTELGLAK